MKKTRRLAITAALAGLYLVALASPAAAHPVTGGEATPLQITITVIGTIITLAGVGAALMATGESTRFSGDRTKLRRGGLALAVVGFLAFLFGPDLAAPATLPCERPATEATLTILEPQPNQTLESGEVELKLDLQGGRIASLASVQNRPGEGHLHISIDGRLATMEGGQEQTLQVPPGSHELEVEYVANDHAPFCKRVADRVRFTVEDAG
ncbi:MAG TPA: hypothetical protein VM754_00845 [Actinomycetota bacterium]|nr:hypothetical protein [Actinomycetota bacterium]